MSSNRECKRALKALRKLFPKLEAAEAMSDELQRSIPLSLGIAEALKAVGGVHLDLSSECGQRLGTAAAALAWWEDNNETPEEWDWETRLAVKNKRGTDVLKIVAMVSGYDPELWAQAREWVLAHPLDLPSEEGRETPG